LTHLKKVGLAAMGKLTFTAAIRSIQPWIRLTRSFDESSHNYLGYMILLEGEIDAQHGRGDESDINSNANFSVGIGKAAHAKHQLKVNDIISGDCLPVPDPDMELVDYYKVSKLKVVSRGEQGSTSAPWETIPSGAGCLQGAWPPKTGSHNI